MPDELAASNVNRTYSLAATSIAIFTFTLIFLYPRFVSGDVDGLLFQATLILMGASTFSFVFAAYYYYGSSLRDRIADADRDRYAASGDRLWLLGSTLMFLAPSMVLFTIRLAAVGAAWLALWLGYLVFVARYFPRVRTTRRAPKA